MILSSHIITASIIAAPLIGRSFDFTNAIFIFIVSFASHYVLDAIPHWDYKLNSFVKVFDENGIYQGERKFVFQKNLLVKDLIKLFIDAIIGLLTIIFLLEIPNIFIIGLIVFAASLPDILQVCHTILNHPKPKILELERKFHHYIHGKRIFENRPVFGIISQIITLAIIAFVFRLI